MFCSYGNARNQPTTPDGYYKYVQVRNVLQHFEADRALACDNSRVVVRVNECKPFFFLKVMSVARCFFEPFPVQDDPSGSNLTLGARG